MTLFLLPYFALIFVGLTMPSDGLHSIFNPKSLCFFFSVTITAWIFITRKKANPAQYHLLTFTLFALATLFGWLLIAAMNDRNESQLPIDHLKIFLITLGFVVMTLYYIQEGLASPKQILRVIIFSNFTYSLAKVILVALHLLKIINIWKFLDMIGFRMMTMSIFGDLSRLQTSVDVITPFLLFFVLQSRYLELNLSKWFKIVYCIVSAISIFLSFSRFLMFVGCMSVLFYWFTLNLRRIFKGILIFAMGLVIAIFSLGLENVVDSFNQRFLSKESFSSDRARFEQVDALMEGHFNAPLFGSGLGGYVKDHIRDPYLRYSYEVQWTAFLFQFGIVGIILLSIPLILIVKQFIGKNYIRFRWTLFGLFLLWILSGFTNPFLISLTSGIIYSLFLMSAFLLNNSERQDSVYSST